MKAPEWCPYNIRRPDFKQVEMDEQELRDNIIKSRNNI